MKLAACLLVVAFGHSAHALRGSAKIKNMITKVLREGTTDTESVSLVADIFDVSGFEDESAVGKVGLNVCTSKPTAVHLTKEQQQVRWQKIDNANSALDTGSWMPAANGVRFKSESGAQIHCAASSGHTRKDKLLVQFDCAPHHTQSEEPRFARLASTFWQACPDGHVPFGWPRQWGEFNYPFYAITMEGVLGCSYLTKDGYCVEDSSTPGAALNTPFGYNDSADSKPAHLFEFDNYSADDLMPGSHYYTSAQAAPAEAPKEGVIETPGTTESEQPSAAAEAQAAAAPAPAADKAPGADAAVQVHDEKEPAAGAGPQDEDDEDMTMPTSSKTNRKQQDQEEDLSMDKPAPKTQTDVEDDDESDMQ